MALQTVTFSLPDVLYQQVKQRAHRMRRSIEDELVAMVTASLPAIDELSAGIAGDIKQLAFLTEAELYEAARATLPAGESKRMQILLLKHQREGLKPEEEEELERLVHHYNQIMLVRAQAIDLLEQNGHDVSNLKQIEI
ncbi:MAG: hypothetical protein GY869_30710 [Planctomycetes bacterium]|nr:hypothetical protein [Planctomycetota bacterium]